MFKENHLIGDLDSNLGVDFNYIWTTEVFVRRTSYHALWKLAPRYWLYLFSYRFCTFPLCKLSRLASAFFDDPHLSVEVQVDVRIARKLGSVSYLDSLANSGGWEIFCRVNSDNQLVFHPRSHRRHFPLITCLR